MKALERRVAELEQRLRHHSGCNVIALETGESLEAGLKRLGRDDAGGCIVVRQILDVDDWCAMAKGQQAALVASGGAP